MTPEQIAEIYGVTKIQAYGLLSFMAAAKIINTSSGTREKGKRGRAPIIYHMDDKAFEICAEAFRVHMSTYGDAGYKEALVEKSELPGEVYDAPVEASKLLSPAALIDAAKEGQALGCSGD